MATPLPSLDRSVRKRVKPGRESSEEEISGESQVSQIHSMSIEKSGRSRERSLILGRRLLIFTERIVNKGGLEDLEGGLEDLEEMTEVNTEVAFGEDSFSFSHD